MVTEANTGITSAERARLAALLEKATPGPWEWIGPKKRVDALAK